MGEQKFETELEAERLRHFTKRLLNDVQALEQMIAGGLFESGVRRIGAEQELFIVDRLHRPAPLAMELLEAIDDQRYTTELGAFNLEFNLDPCRWGGSCLRKMERQLEDLLSLGREAAARHDARLVLAGILPTLQLGDLGLGNMTPMPRYRALNEAMTRLRGGAYQFRIKGRDELIVSHDNVMLEACNTSFQVHFQVAPEEFSHLYNVAQALAGPVLAVAANSPLLFGRQLWRETRIALFQQSIDTRLPGGMREQTARVNFGSKWVRESVLEIFKEDIARFRVLLGGATDEDPQAVLAAGGVPRLGALCLHNGTVYRWMRPCYGITAGKPHLRIENRVLPAGPTVIDEVSNAAFWLGLMSQMAREHADITREMEFDHAKENFVACARLGLSAQLTWLRGKELPARELLREELLPLAREGLAAGGIDAADADRYLGVIEERVEAGRTGAQWLVDSCAAMSGQGNRGERLAALVAAMERHQREGEPVHRWPLAELDDAGGWRAHHRTLGQFMTTDLFTVFEGELVDLVAAMMDWRHIRHVPVEDGQHRLVGLVTYRTLVRMVAKDLERFRSRPTPVSEVMQRDIVTASPDTSTLEAIRLMRRHRIGCLPVVDRDRLVGIVTERDFMNISGALLEEVLAVPGDGRRDESEARGAD